MSKGAGPSPDFGGLADKMGQWNLGANQQQTLANRPNQYTPWGSTTWSQAPGGWNGSTGSGNPYPGPGQPGGPGSPGGPNGGGGATGSGGGSGGGPASGGGGAGGGHYTPVYGGGAVPAGDSMGGQLLGGPVVPGGSSSGGIDYSAAPPAGSSSGSSHPALPPGVDAPNGPGGPQVNATGPYSYNPNNPQQTDAYNQWLKDHGIGTTPGSGGGGSMGGGAGGGTSLVGGGGSGGDGINPPGPPQGVGLPGGGTDNTGGGGSAPWWSPQASGMPGQWSETTTLNPQLQAAADAQMKLQNQRSGFGLQQFGNLSNAMKNPFSLGALPQGGSAFDPNSLQALGTGMDARNAAESALYGRATSRLDPQWNQREEQERTMLANQGLDPSSQAFKTEMDNFSRARNDAYDQARLGAQAGGGQEQALQFGMGLQGNQQKLGAQAQGYGQAEQTRGRTLAELLQQRELPINEMNALMNGQNVSMPQFGPFMGAGAAQSPNYLGAGQMQGNYNLGNAQMQNGMYGDIGQGLGTFAKFLPFLFG